MIMEMEMEMEMELLIRFINYNTIMYVLSLSGKAVSSSVSTYIFTADACMPCTAITQRFSVNFRKEKRL